MSRLAVWAALSLSLFFLAPSDSRRRNLPTRPFNKCCKRKATRSPSSKRKTVGPAI